MLLSIGAVAVAQRGGGRWRRELDLSDRRGVPDWQLDEEFKDDAFTFARVRYTQMRGGWYGGGGWGSWNTDCPDSDLNFSYRLHELTAIDVNPNFKIVELTDDELFDYPFIYLIEPGRGLWLDDAEVAALRRYLLNGGFLMVDDFWGEHEWSVFYEQIKRVFPDREPVELPLEHEIFHLVYDLKKKPQVPSIHAWWQGMTTERFDAQEAHYRAIFDDKGRMMAIICHNTDLGDGWEREGEDPGYFKEMSERWAYPLGINIVTYAMTH
ncbi:MAG TPA: DUF4159 domain-containing protein [Pirellulales bacterium]|nr:DUF4159 domain-containing protein [Pirellulales bacterium]